VLGAICEAAGRPDALQTNLHNRQTER
jgi:hypothetical protein